MRLIDVDREAVVSTIARMPEQFYTKDLSQHPDMLSVHAVVKTDPRYHQMVGTFLSRLSREPGSPVRMESDHNQLGQQWRRRK
jgi:hypothetical protein